MPRLPLQRTFLLRILQFSRTKFPSNCNFHDISKTINAKGEVTEIEIPYLVFEAADEDAALAAARSTAASRTVSGMVLDEVEVTERVNKGMRKVKAIPMRLAREKSSASPS